MSILQTADGSNTYISKVFGETYHSRHGALQESLHVFIDHGLHRFRSEFPDLPEIRIFEMGLGTGLNALLCATLPSELYLKTKLYYTSVEKFPLSPEEAQGMSFEKHIEDPEASTIFHQVHQSDWGEWINLREGFFFQKLKGDFFDLQLKDHHIIFYDAFAPAAQSELWTQEACELLFEMLAPHGIITTYCAQGQFKRNLKAAGFEVEALPGPPGKREMTLGRKR